MLQLGVSLKGCKFCLSLRTNSCTTPWNLKWVHTYTFLYKCLDIYRIATSWQFPSTKPKERAVSSRDLKSMYSTTMVCVHFISNLMWLLNRVHVTTLSPSCKYITSVSLEVNRKSCDSLALWCTTFGFVHSQLKGKRLEMSNYPTFYYGVSFALRKRMYWAVNSNQFQEDNKGDLVCSCVCMAWEK